MPRRDLLQPAGLRAEQADGLFWPAVDRVGERERPDTEVVVCPRLEEHLFDGARRGVAPRLDEHDRRWLVGQHIDRIAWRRAHQLATRAFQLDLVEPILFDREAGREHAVVTTCQVCRGRLVEHQPARRRAHRREHQQPHLGAAQHDDVTAVLDQAWLEPGVDGEVIFELEVVDIRQVDDVEGERVRPDADRHDEVARLFTHVEQERLETTRDRRLAFLRNHRHRLERGAGARAHEQVDVARIEPDQLRRDGRVGPTGDCGVSRHHVDVIRAGRVETAGRGHQRRRAISQIRRPQDERKERKRRHADQIAGRASDLLPLDRRPPVERTAVLHGVLDEPVDERR